MTDTSFHLSIGKFKCTVISDGFITVPGQMSPGLVSRPEDRPGERMDVCCLVIDTGSRRVLVDTGCGNSFQSTSGKLMENLSTAGIGPESIDLIIYTHAHADHVGGTVDSAGKLVLTRARQVLSKLEWDYLTGPEEGPTSGMFALARKTLLPLRDHFDLVSDNYQVTPGIRLMPAAGHTPGGVTIEASSGNDRMLCIGDLIHSRVEFTQPGIYSFLDSAPEEARRLRTDGLSRIAESGTLVFACHMPFPGIGHFVRKGQVLDWQPI